MTKLPFPSTKSEFEGAEFGDARLTGRLHEMVGRLEAQPGLSFPKASTSVSNLEATYRFLNNDKVDPEKILASHVEFTWKRASFFNEVLSVEDTTELRYGGASWREGLGKVANGGQGFFLHTALLVGFDGERFIPLGVPAYEMMVRGEPRKDLKNWRSMKKDPAREKLRWHRLAEATDARSDRPLIHVADREADDYDLLCAIAGRGGRHVIRLTKNRIILDTPLDFVPKKGQAHASINDVVQRAAGVLTREVPLPRSHASSTSRRSKKPREARLAHLSFKAITVRLKAPQLAASKEPLVMNIVDVFEENPPEGEEPLHWRLATSEPIETTEQVAAIVDMYRGRWLVEEFFKVLKTGCAVEERQLESLDALKNALAIFIPIAWQMLLLRHVARDLPDTPAERVISPRLHELLRFLAQPANNVWKMKLSDAPTAGEVLFAIARIGGHLPNNGPPGWLTIHRGFDELLKYERVFAAVAQM